jgi:hypothetical protein
VVAVNIGYSPEFHRPNLRGWLTGHRPRPPPNSPTARAATSSSRRIHRSIEDNADRRPYVVQLTAATGERAPFCKAKMTSAKIAECRSWLMNESPRWNPRPDRFVDFESVSQKAPKDPRARGLLARMFLASGVIQEHSGNRFPMRPL